MAEKESALQHEIGRTSVSFYSGGAEVLRYAQNGERGDSVAQWNRLARGIDSLG